jgi:hypothetical protein
MFRRFSWTVVVVVAALGAAAASIAATHRPAARSTGLGARLVNRFFTELKRHDVAGLRRLLSPAFQIQRADGSRVTKTQYLHHLPNVISYKLRDLRTTSTRTAVVVTYQAATKELINGKKVQSRFAPRLSVFLLGARRWQLVGHGNFNPPA